jgi:hypothetical protein
MRCQHIIKWILLDQTLASNLNLSYTVDHLLFYNREITLGVLSREEHIKILRNTYKDLVMNMPFCFQMDKCPPTQPLKN